MIDFLLTLLGAYLIVAAMGYFVVLVALWDERDWVGNLFLSLFFALFWPYLLVSYIVDRAKSTHWLLLFMLLLPSCAGPKTTHTDGKRVVIQTPLMHRVTVTVEPGRTTVASEPPNVVESAVSGLVGAVGKLFLTPQKQPE